MRPMMEMLKTGFYKLKPEETHLKERAEIKETTGSVPRYKQSSHNGPKGNGGYFVWLHFGSERKNLIGKPSVPLQCASRLGPLCKNSIGKPPRSSEITSKGFCLYTSPALLQNFSLVSGYELSSTSLSLFRMAGSETGSEQTRLGLSLIHI